MKLVILDRDGVINRDSDAYVKAPEEWVPIDGSLQAIARLERAGWTTTVATNQSGLGRGLFELRTLCDIHRTMEAAVSAAGGRIHGVFYCPHRPKDRCDCRKPKPGLLHEIALRFGISLEAVPVIGDARRDLEAAQTVGARPILVLTGKGRATLDKLEAHDDLEGIEVYEDLAAAVDALLDETRGAQE